MRPGEQCDASCTVDCGHCKGGRLSSPATVRGVDLRADGVLWLLNASVFHPRGFALGLNADDELVLLGDGSEPWRFADDCDEQFAAVEALFDRCRAEPEPAATVTPRRGAPGSGRGRQVPRFESGPARSARRRS